MSPQHGSPNWHWQQLGYQIERQPTPSGNRRTIRRPDGTAVAIEQQEGEPRHDAEVRAAMIERQRLPHGPDECQAAQLDIFNDSKDSAA